ncbi:MAG: alpha/beta fold hydrolase [Gemmatimonadaceae bacterium]|nr:alpha/beta fold hydrolase [Gemmatimonadaceae bacterium]
MIFTLRARHARVLLIVAASVAITVAATRAHAQQPAPISYVYLSSRGDTLGVETITRHQSSVHGLLAMRGQPPLDWTQAFANGAAGVLTLRSPQNANTRSAAMQTQSYHVRGDSAYVDGGTTSRRVIASKADAHPLALASALHTALIVANVRARQRKSFDALLVTGMQTLSGTMSKTQDATSLSMGNLEMRVSWSPDSMPSAIMLPWLDARVVRASSRVPTSRVAAAPVKSRYDPPAGASYSAQHVRVPTGRGYELAATLTRPNGIAAPPVVVTISGSGPQDRDGRGAYVGHDVIFRAIADTLARRGIATLRWDDRGVGESGGVESAATGTTRDVAADVSSIVAWLRARGDVDGARIALAGHSEGGLVAPLVAASDARIKAVALLAGPAVNGRRVLLWQQQKRMEPLGLSRSERDAQLANFASRLDASGAAVPWLRYFLTYDPLPTARLLRMPVLVMQGLTDQQVSPDDADALVAAVKSNGNRDVTLRKFPATNHLFVNDAVGAVSGYNALPDMAVRRDVLGALADWAVRVLR